MLKNCIFNESVIPCATLERLISCLALIHVTQLYLLWVLFFNRSRKIRYFHKNVTFLILEGCLQPFRLVYVPKVLIR